MVKDIRTQLKESALYPVLVLESIITHKSKHALLSLGSILVILFATLVMVGTIYPPLEAWRLPLIGLFFINVSLLLTLYALETYYRSLFSQSTTGAEAEASLVSFEAGRVLYEADGADALGALLESEIGEELTARLNIPETAIRTLIQAHAIDQTESKVSLSRTKYYTLADVVSTLYESHNDFARVLTQQGVTKEECVHAAQWVESRAEMVRTKEQWWTRENLARIPGIGKDWSYGGTWRLEHYAEDITQVYNARPLLSSYTKELSQIETVLARGKGANVLLQSEPLASARFLEALVYSIRSGNAHPAIEHKRVLVLKVERLVSSFKERTGFSREVEFILREAENAGNIILAIESLGSFEEGTRAFGIESAELLKPFLNSSSLHILMLATPDAYHRIVREGWQMLPYFEQVRLTKPRAEEFVLGILKAVDNIERQTKVLFTYGALTATVESVERHFSETDVEDKLLDIITEGALWARAKGISSITREEILSFVSEKTGIPLGRVSETERASLLNLEEILRAHVIGQDTALHSIATALRRNRAELGNNKKPIGSFLFLGPTGVGKTQTAKALAQILFGDEDQLTRFDMSEFSSPNGLAQLIGTGSEPGVLSSALKDKPYTILLLDEFEKAHETVKDLFLQIIDEGIFHDGRGVKVNARNALIIATSNAGASHVWWLLDEGKKIEEEKNSIIDGIIHDGYFKPELLNRFDALVLFTPLSFETRQVIATHELSYLKEKLKEQGLTLITHQAMTDALAHSGDNREWGARPMKRFIQDVFENQIAEKKLAGELRAGDTFSFVTSDQEPYLLITKEIPKTDF